MCIQNCYVFFLNWMNPLSLYNGHLCPSNLLWLKANLYFILVWTPRHSFVCSLIGMYFLSFSFNLLVSFTVSESLADSKWLGPHLIHSASLFLFPGEGNTLTFKVSNEDRWLSVTILPLSLSKSFYTSDTWVLLPVPVERERQGLSPSKLREMQDQDVKASLPASVSRLLWPLFITGCPQVQGPPSRSSPSSQGLSCCLGSFLLILNSEELEKDAAYNTICHLHRKWWEWGHDVMFVRII